MFLNAFKKHIKKSLLDLYIYMPTTFKKSKRKGYRKYKPASRKFMSTGLARARINLASTTTMYFKINGTINATLVPLSVPPKYYYHAAFKTSAPFDLGDPQMEQFKHARFLWNKYRLLSQKVKLFPANVYNAANWSSPPLIQSLEKGDCVSWIVQRDQQGQPNVYDIPEVINSGSAKMVNINRPLTLYQFRTKEFYDFWGNTNFTGPTADDPWDGSINLLGTDIRFGIASPTLGFPKIWHYTVNYKIEFKSRSW